MLMAVAVGGMLLAQSSCKKDDKKPEPTPDPKEATFTAGLYRVTDTKYNDKEVSLKSDESIQNGLEFMNMFAMLFKSDGSDPDGSKTAKVKNIVLNAFKSAASVGLEFKADNKVTLNLAEAFKDGKLEGTYTQDGTTITMKFAKGEVKKDATPWYKYIAEKFSEQEVKMTVVGAKLQWTLKSQEVLTKTADVMMGDSGLAAAATSLLGMLPALKNLKNMMPEDFIFLLTKIK